MILRQWYDTDPLNHYKPGVTQERCLRSQVLYRLLSGPNQVGKTAHCVMECAMLARGRHPYRPTLANVPVEILIVVPSRAQAVSVWGDRLLKRCRLPGEIGKHPLIPAREILKVYNNSSGSGPAPQRIELKNGSNIYFAWSSDDDQWTRIQGIMVDFIFRDEGSGNKALGAELYPRLLRAQTEKPGAGGILWSATPTLINEEFEHYKKLCRTSAPNYEEFFIQSHENPAISREVRERMRGSLSEDDQRIRLDGDVSAMELAQVYGRQWDNAKNIAAEDYVPTPHDNLWVVMDPGFDHPWGTIICAINKAEPTKLRVIRYFWQRRASYRDNLDLVIEFLQGRFVEGIVVDPASYKTDTSGKSLYTLIGEYFDEQGVVSHHGVMTSRNRHEGGIELVQQYIQDGLVVFNPHSPGCGQAAAEMIGYMGRPETRYTGPHGVVKKNDEACLTGETIVTSGRGGVPICEIRPGDIVLTRHGWFPVAAAGMTSRSAETLLAIFSDGTTMRGTAEHPVLVDGRGFIQLGQLAVGDTVCTPNKKPISSFSTGLSSGDTLAQSSGATAAISSPMSPRDGEGSAPCTRKYGSLSMGISRTGTTFTTGTGTHSTTTLSTLNACPPPTISLPTTTRGRHRSTWRGFRKWLRNGIALLLGGPGTAGIPARPMPEERRGLTSVSNVGKISARSTLETHDFAATHARRDQGSCPVQITSRAAARPAALSSPPIDTFPSGHAPVYVVGLFRASRSAVYNLTVDGPHEFYANGILVHNCDCIRYLVMHEPAWACRTANHALAADGSDPTIERLEETDDQRTHRLRLETSARLLAQIRRKTGPPSMPEGVLRLG